MLWVYLATGRELRGCLAAILKRLASAMLLGWTGEPYECIGAGGSACSRELVVYPSRIMLYRVFPRTIITDDLRTPISCLLVPSSMCSFFPTFHLTP